MNKPAGFHSKISFEHNVHYELRDKDGNLKPLFNENKLGFVILKFFRKIVANPIDEMGQVKKGLLNYLSAYGLRIPLLTGIWKNYRFQDNLITNAGFAGIADLIGPQGSAAQYKYIANGTGAVAAAVTDTALGAESSASGLARTAGTPTRVTTGVTNDTANITNAFSAGASLAITECGLFNAASVGTMLARQVFSAVNVVSADTWTPTWKIQAH